MAKAGRAALALAAGFGSGFLDERDAKARRDREEQDRAMRKEEHDARMGELRRDNDSRMALSAAARPTTVEEGAGGALRPPTMDDRDVGQPGEAPVSLGAAFRAGGQTFTNRADANTAAAAYNSEDATDKRIGLAMVGSGDVKGAKAYQASTAQAKASGAEFAEKQFRRGLTKAMMQGHEGLATFVTNSQGTGLAPYKLKAVPSPDGKQVTYHKLNDDGSTTPTALTFTNDQDGVIRATAMLDSTITPDQRYSHMVAEDKLAAQQSTKEKELELRKRQLEEVQIPNAETRARLAEVQASLAELRASKAAAGGGDKVSREERMRYTTLFSEAGRRMSDAQKSLRALMANPMYSMAKPGSAQHAELEALRGDIKSYSDERGLYGGLLAASSGKKDEGKLSDTKPKPVKVATKAERDKLKPGTSYIGPDGVEYIKK